MDMIERTALALLVVVLWLIWRDLTSSVRHHDEIDGELRDRTLEDYRARAHRDAEAALHRLLVPDPQMCGRQLRQPIAGPKSPA
jgi:hypothetical protein